ncbi:hypothetical protein A7S16_16895 [Salmonella enterica]|nr:hypothetical protein A7S11_21990 [Salmonella enterica]OHK96722.1 hypothetical protein A7S87_15080 [Salmonella enterica subsp. enterica serovar Rubislaw]PUN86373.1 hypothetical protein DAX58_24095 [Salmonella enterica subsp. enterica]OHI11424.1 hypothetical protein A7S13_22750 [Salmonella enterica]OHI16420.1 hypothetical protein A7S14_22325 [Salmonella enterica]
MLPAGHYLQNIQLASKRKSKPDSQLTLPKKEESEMKEENEMKFKEPEHHPYHGDDLRNIFIKIEDKYSPCGDLLFRLDHLTAVKRTGEQAYFSVLYIKNDTYEGNVPYDAFMHFLKMKFDRIAAMPLEPGKPVIITFTVTKEMATSKIRLPPED